MTKDSYCEISECFGIYAKTLANFTVRIFSHSIKSFMNCYVTTVTKSRTCHLRVDDLKENSRRHLMPIQSIVPLNIGVQI